MDKFVLSFLIKVKVTICSLVSQKVTNIKRTKCMFLSSMAENILIYSDTYTDTVAILWEKNRKREMYSTAPIFLSFNIFSWCQCLLLTGRTCSIFSVCQRCNKFSCQREVNKFLTIVPDFRRTYCIFQSFLADFFFYMFSYRFVMSFWYKLKLQYVLLWA